MHTKILNYGYIYEESTNLKQHVYSTNKQHCSPSTYMVTTSLILPKAPSLHVTVVLESVNMALSIVIVDGLSLLPPVVSILG